MPDYAVAKPDRGLEEPESKGGELYGYDPLRLSWQPAARGVRMDDETTS